MVPCALAGLPSPPLTSQPLCAAACVLGGGVCWLQGGGQVSHMVRFAGNMHARQHRFWLDVPAGAQVGVRLYVKHLEESPAAAALLASLPDWTSPAAVVCWQSSWQF